MDQVQESLRVEERKSLFVQATLHYIEGFCSVKVRNISATGALIEAESLPRSGTPVELRRGGLMAAGTVMWKRNGRAGIEFLGQTDVSRWMPNTGPQVAGDGSFQVFKGTPASAFTVPQPAAVITTHDIQAVASLLDDLARTFAADAGVLFNYSTKLQALDIASQMLRTLASQAKDRRRR